MAQSHHSFAHSVERGLEWHSAAKRYLERLGSAEYRAHACQKRRKARYSPSDYHRELIGYLDRNDEHGFKARKMLSGYASALGV